jgi:hypothetical protein
MTPDPRLGHSAEVLDRRHDLPACIRPGDSLPLLRAASSSAAASSSLPGIKCPYRSSASCSSIGPAGASSLKCVGVAAQSASGRIACRIACKPPDPMPPLATKKPV